MQNPTAAQNNMANLKTYEDGATVFYVMKPHVNKLICYYMLHVLSPFKVDDFTVLK